MTREHLYPRIWKSQSCTATMRSSTSDVYVETAGSRIINSVPVLYHDDPIGDVKNWSLYSLQFFTETFDHHLTQTPVEHIDRAKVITGSKVIDFPTMRIARLLEELSLTATDRTDAELECQRLRHEFAEKYQEIEAIKVRCEKAEREVKSLHEINMHLGRERNELRKESVELRDREQALKIAHGQAASMRSQEIEKLQIELAAFKKSRDDFERNWLEVCSRHSELVREAKELRECNDTQCKTIRSLREKITELRGIVGSAEGADKEALVAIGKSLGLKETASLGEIMDRAEKVAAFQKDIDAMLKCRNDELSNLSRDKRELIGQLAVVREELSATNARNAVQAQTIRDYQQKEDAADAHHDAIQDLQRRVGKVERCLGEAGRASPGTHG